MDADHRQPHGRNLRKGRYSIPGQIYLVTTVTSNRARIFHDLYRARCAIHCIHDDTMAVHASTLAFVIMPDHVHWVLQLKERAPLPDVVRLYKARVSSNLGQRIWQRGFHDHALRMDEDVVDVSRYVVANPLRAGLVEHIGDYPHWDAVWLTGQ